MKKNINKYDDIVKEIELKECDLFCDIRNISDNLITTYISLFKSLELPNINKILLSQNYEWSEKLKDYFDIIFISDFSLNDCIDIFSKENNAVLSIHGKYNDGINELIKYINRFHEKYSFGIIEFQYNDFMLKLIKKSNNKSSVKLFLRKNQNDFIIIKKVKI